jgi:2-C-methyl-D-erythritol 2,4-cyclodiphosphate synthase
MLRVGLGQDSHKIIQSSERSMVLGGVKINGFAVEAKSDGDVVLHALVNALSSAVGGGSISNYADPLFKKGVVDSREYVKEVLKKMDGYRVNNVSVAIEAKEPKLESVIKQMKESIANILEISKENVGVTVTSGEGLTAFGKGSGIQAFVIASIYKNE